VIHAKRLAYRCQTAGIFAERWMSGYSLRSEVLFMRLMRKALNRSRPQVSITQCEWSKAARQTRQGDRKEAT